MTILRPFFSYYGSKWRAAQKLPRPKFTTIVEPFAGSAGYSLNYADRAVKLFDPDENIFAAWSYLIGADPKRILEFPTFEPKEKISDHEAACGGFSKGEKAVLGMNIARCASGPRPTANKRGAETFTRPIIERMARQVSSIRHWEIENKGYEDIDIHAYGDEVTWMIDPVYRGDKNYKHGKNLDYEALGKWCRSLPGQVIVTEGPAHGGWLPFKPYTTGVDAHQTGEKVEDFFWTND